MGGAALHVFVTQDLQTSSYFLQKHPKKSPILYTCVQASHTLVSQIAHLC